MASLTEFRLVYDEFSRLTDGKVNYYLSAATTWVNAISNKIINSWGENAPTIKDELIYLLAAHNLLIQYHEQLNLGGSIAAIDAGTQPSPNSNLIDYLNLTSYGKRYLTLTSKFDKFVMQVI